MPALMNPRWEAFATAVAQGMAEPAAGWTQAKAYEASGYAAQGPSAAANASRLLKYATPVVARIQELRALQNKRSKVTIDSVSARLTLASRIAEEDRVPNALVAAESAIAKLNGLVIERAEQGKPGDFSNNSSTYDIASRVLADAGAADPTAAQIAMAQEELARHARAIEAIASDTALAAVQA